MELIYLQVFSIKKGCGKYQVHGVIFMFKFKIIIKALKISYYWLKELNIMQLFSVMV